MHNSPRSVQGVQPRARGFIVATAFNYFLFMGPFLQTNYFHLFRDWFPLPPKPHPNKGLWFVLEVTK